MNLPFNTNPNEWHHKPRGTSGPCPICGISSAQPGEHRATSDSEPLDAIWIKRRKRGGEWQYTEVGSRKRQAEQGPPLDKMAVAANILAQGGTANTAATEAGVSRPEIRRWKICFPMAWGQAFAAALRQVDATEWHHVPNGFSLCPICGFGKVGEHRLASDIANQTKWERRKQETKSGEPSNANDIPTSELPVLDPKTKRKRQAAKPRTPKGPGPDVVKGMTVATFALATGATLQEAASAAGATYSAMRDWKRLNPAHWQALYASAMRQVLASVRAAVGTDTVLQDPTRFVKQAAACEKWVEKRGESLFPRRDDRPTLSSFYSDYFKPNCLIDAKNVTVETYDQVVRHWTRLTGDPPLEEITVPVLAKFRECQSRMRGRKPGSKKSPNSVRTVLRHLQTILDKTGEPHRRNRDAAGILDKVPYIKAPKELVRNPVSARLDQLDAIYRAAVATELPRVEGFKPPAWWRALLVVTLNTAFRRRTLFELRMSDIRWQERCIVVDPEQVKNSVGGIVPLNDTTLNHLQAIRTDRELVFPWPHDMTHFHTCFHRLQDAAGLPQDDHFGLHAIRKLAATLLWEHSPAIAQLTLGHASLRTTRKHYVAGSDMFRKAVDQLPQPDSFIERSDSKRTESPEDNSTDERAA